MTQEALALQVKVGFGKGVEPAIDKDNVVVQVAPARILEFARFARDQLGFDYLTSITAVDNGDAFELLYHWVSIRPSSPTVIEPAYPGYLLARVTVTRDHGAETTGSDGEGARDSEYEPIVASITQVFPGANQQEREIYDLMGIRFKGHPRLERILLWEGFPGHPLRKDWRPLNVEIPWHLAGLKGFGGETMEEAPAEARIATDGSGISQPIPIGTTTEAPRYPATRPAKPSETMRIKLGQGGLVDDEGPDGPTIRPGIGEPSNAKRIAGSESA
ncbi:MAG: NADH-quinone oxidoreductase subunit C [Candidatus Dormibacteria bacterium]